MDENYLFAYSCGDGFSSRGLTFEYLVDYDCNYELELSVNAHEKKTKNNSDKIIEKGVLAGDELLLIEKLLSSDYNSLKQIYDYEGLDITDIGIQQIFINLDKTTKYVEILDGLPIECFESEVELLLFELNKYMLNKSEIMYENWTVD
ncbi:hypothetical protein ACU8DI_15305 [Psychroserpens sp. BH13MA-6]